jgi:hypothetical protein
VIQLDTFQLSFGTTKLFILSSAGPIT